MLRKRTTAALVTLLTALGLTIGIVGPAEASETTSGRDCKFPISSSTGFATGDAIMESSASGWRVKFIHAEVGANTTDAHINGYWYAGNLGYAVNTLFTGWHVAQGDERWWGPPKTSDGPSSWIPGGNNPYVRLHFHKNSDLSLYLVMTLHPNGGSTCTYFS